MRLLEIQADHAQASGQVNLERRIRANLAELRRRTRENPPPAAVAVRRSG
jgi:hypothetical protein